MSCMMLLSLDFIIILQAANDAIEKQNVDDICNSMDSLDAILTAIKDLPRPYELAPMITNLIAHMKSLKINDMN